MPRRSAAEVRSRQKLSLNHLSTEPEETRPPSQVYWPGMTPSV